MGWIDEINLIVAMVDQKSLETKFSLEAFHFYKRLVFTFSLTFSSNTKQTSNSCYG